MPRQAAPNRPTVREDVLAAYEEMQGARSQSPAGDRAAHFVEIDDLVGRTREDRETARRVNAFLHDERGTAEHTTNDGAEPNRGCCSPAMAIRWSCACVRAEGRSRARFVAKGAL
jgi:hypothetical protein